MVRVLTGNGGDQQLLSFDCVLALTLLWVSAHHGSAIFLFHSQVKGGKEATPDLSIAIQQVCGKTVW